MAKKLPNIILIVLDTCAAKHMSLYGYQRRTTPNLERMAENLTVYRRCFSPSCWTIPAHASMFTGLYPNQHGAHERSFYLDDRCVHLVDLLAKAGYRTYGISCNGLVSPITGIAKYFQVFLDYGKQDILHLSLLEDAAAFQSFLNSPPQRNFGHEIKFLLKQLQKKRCFSAFLKVLGSAFKKKYFPGPVGFSPKYSKKSLETAIKMIMNHYNKEAEPFFLFINLMETHEWFTPPVDMRKYSSKLFKQTINGYDFYRKEYSEKIDILLPPMIDLYDDEVLFLDSLLGQFWDKLTSHKLLDNTVLIITSDHGEHFGEKGYFEHNLSLYNELIWVPLLIKSPDSLLSHGTIHHPVSLNDIYSTLLDLAENPFPRPFSSQSLLAKTAPKAVASVILDPSWWEKRYFGNGEPAGECQESCKSAVMLESGLKIVWKKQGGIEIYDLNCDLAEEVNLYTPQKYETLKNFLKEPLDSLGLPGEAQQI